LRIFDAHVHGWPATLMRSLIATGTAVGFAAASFSAASSSKVRYAPISPFFAR